jgi:hypothetical protein
MSTPDILRGAGGLQATQGIMGEEAEAIGFLSGAGLMDVDYAMPQQTVREARRAMAQGRPGDAPVPIVNLGANVGVGTAGQALRGIGEAVGIGGGMERVLQARISANQIQAFQGGDFGMGAIPGVTAANANQTRRELQNMWQENQSYIEGASAEDIVAMRAMGDTAPNELQRAAPRMLGRARNVLISQGKVELAGADDRTIAALINVGSGGTSQLSQYVRIAKNIGRFSVGMSASEIREKAQKIAKGAFMAGLSQFRDRSLFETLEQGAPSGAVRTATVEAMQGAGTLEDVVGNLQERRAGISEAMQETFGQTRAGRIFGELKETMLPPETAFARRRLERTVGGMALDLRSADVTRMMMEDMTEGTPAERAQAQVFLALQEERRGTQGALRDVGRRRKRMELQTADMFGEGADAGLVEKVGKATQEAVMGLSAEEQMDILRQDELSLAEGAKTKFHGSAILNRKIVENLKAQGLKGVQLVEAIQGLQSQAGREGTHLMVQGLAQKAFEEDVVKMKDQRRQDADRYGQWSIDSSLEEELNATGVAGASRVAGKVEDLMNYLRNPTEERGAFLSTVNSHMTGIAGDLAKMDVEDLAEYAQVLESVAEQSGSSAIAELAMKARSMGQFRGSLKKVNKRKGLKGKLQTAAALFGDTPEARRALGLAGKKDMQKFIRAQFKETGTIPLEQRDVLKRIQTRKLMAAGRGRKAAEAAAEQQISEALGASFSRDRGDRENVTGEEFEGLVKTGFITGAEGSAAVDAMRQGAQGRGRVGDTKAVEDFSKALTGATGALIAFRATMGNNDAEDGPKKE